jgi:hypothetical protein
VRVGLYNLEPKIVNTAMMQVSQYHKERGDTVEPYIHFAHDEYDKIYAFSLFDFTSKKMVRKDMICGGTGFDIKSRLPAEVEACDYDWSLYPECDFSIVRFSVGCCYQPGIHPYCIVPKKEGCIRPVEPKNLNTNGKWIVVCDNNFFANPEWREAVVKTGNTGQFKFNSYLEGIGVSDTFFTKAEGLAKDAFSDVVEMPSGFYILRVKARDSIDEKKFDAEKAAVKKRLEEQKKQELFGKYVTDLVQKALK